MQPITSSSLSLPHNQVEPIPISAAPPATTASSSSFGINISWDKLNYFVKSSVRRQDETRKQKGNESRPILHALSGQAFAGRTLAIMGSSGAGKTTLLNALAGRLANDGEGGDKYLTGGVRLNDIPYSGAHYKRLMGYVPQDDILGPMSTPTTALNFTIRVRLGVSTADAQAATTRIIDKLKLKDCKHTIVGIPGVIAGLSGGERKRLNIGTELIVNTKLLLCDEPTSGLDSNTSLMIIKSLSDIAREDNRTVIFTVHQPTRAMTELFDDILLLTGGKVAYHGPMRKATAYFACIGFPCPVTYTPTDHFMVLLQDAAISGILVQCWERFLLLNGVVGASAPSRSSGGGATPEDEVRDAARTEPVCFENEAKSVEMRTVPPEAPATDTNHDNNNDDADDGLPAYVKEQRANFKHFSIDNEALKVVANPSYSVPTPSAVAPPQSNGRNNENHTSRNSNGLTSDPTTPHTEVVVDAGNGREQQQQPDKDGNKARLRFNAVHPRSLPAAIATTNPTALYISHYFTHVVVPSRRIQWLELFKRCFAFVYTNKQFVMTTVMQTIVFSLIAGLIFLNVEDDITGIQDRFGLFFMVIFAASLTNAMGVVNRFKPLRELFIREQQSGSYPVFTYFACSFLVDIPLFAVSVMIQSLIVYFMTGLHRSAHNFFVFYAILTAMCQVGLALGAALSSMLNNDLLATAAIPCTVIPMMLCGGLLANNEQIRPYWVWLEKLSIIRSGFLLMVHLELPTIHHISCDISKYGATCLRQPKTGTEFIHFKEFDSAQDQSWAMWLQLALMFLLLRGLNFLGLYLTSRKKF